MIPQVLCVLLFVTLKDIQCDQAFRCYHCLGGRTFSSCFIQTCLSSSHVCFFNERLVRGQFHQLYAGCTKESTCKSINTVTYTSLSTYTECRACCKTDLCNLRNCNAKGSVVHLPTSRPPVTTEHLPLCFSCDESESVSECTKTTVCAVGQHCFMEAYSTGTNEVKYYGGCASSSTCTSNSLPTRSGHKICSSCCEHDYCNSDVCSDKVESYITSLSKGKRQCSRCYDQTLDDLSRCYSKVECAHSTSQCSQVLRNDSGILTVDMDCEENLPCTSTVGTDHDVCDICCNWDFCNREVDCRYPVTMTSPQTTPSSIPQKSNSSSTSKQCYHCADTRVDSTGNFQCYSKVTCASPTSKCSTVYFEDNGIVTVSMGCDEELPCDAPIGASDICGSCCDTDLCNQHLDCRTGQPTNQPSTILPSTIQSRNYTAVECEVCSGAECGVDSRRAVSVRCNNTTPYCLNTVLNDVNGDKHVTKKCGSVSECESKWLQKSSLLEDCLNFDPSNIYSHSFECTYCCVTHNCNRNIRPQNDTLYNPGVYLP